MKNRSLETELMDDLELSNSELFQTLHQLDTINRWLAESNVFSKSIASEIRKRITENESSILVMDIGCGSGDLLRRIHNELSREELRRVRLMGIDANPNIVEYAKSKSDRYDLSIECKNVLEKADVFEKADIVLSTLFFHHFNESQITDIVSNFGKDGTQFLINDLQRSTLAVFLFRLISVPFGLSRMAKNDGVISIKRAFTKKELEELFGSMNVSDLKISWQWAFRYQIAFKK